MVFHLYFGGERIANPTIVHALDECLFIIPKTIFQKIHFDEKVCNAWDLYAVDYCYAIRKLKLIVYVIPIKIYHHSTGHLSVTYFKSLRKIFVKYGLKNVYTTSKDWNYIRALYSYLFLKFPLLYYIIVYKPNKIREHLIPIMKKIYSLILNKI